MNNATGDVPPTMNFFRRHFLGTSFQHILLRLSLILSSIIVVWCGIMLGLIIHTKCQRMKQIQKGSTTHHHHLTESTSSLTRNRPNKTPRNPSTLNPCRILSRLFSRFFSSSRVESIERNGISTGKQNKIELIAINNSRSTSNKIQHVVRAIKRRSTRFNQKNSRNDRKLNQFGETDSSSGEESKTIEISFVQNNLNAEKQGKLIRGIDLNTMVKVRSSTLTEESTKICSNQEKKKSKFSFRPITRHLSNISKSSLLSPKDEGGKGSNLNLTSTALSNGNLTKNNNDRRWVHSTMSNQETNLYSNLNRSVRHIPLVMITDTSSSNTNIVELETYEDRHYKIGDAERRLSQELRASYRPRHST